MNAEPTSAKLPAELRLLLAVLRPSPDAETEAVISGLLSSAIQWDYLLDMAAWHGVVPLVALNLAERHAVPLGVREQLKASSFDIAARNLQLSAALTKAISALDRAGIPSIAYKGVVLSEYLYGNIAMRPAADVDLIVRAEDFPSAYETFQSNGFRDRFGFDKAQRAAMLKYYFEYGFTGHGANLDVHWQLVQSFAWLSQDLPRMWNQLESFTFSGRTVQIFRPELMLVTLCIHAAQHQWLHLKLLADIAQFLRKCPDVDAPSVAAWLRDDHAGRSFSVSLYLVKNFLHAEIPAALQRLVCEDREVSAIADRTVQQGWPSSHDPIASQAHASHWFLHTRGERFRDRLRFIAGSAFWPTIEDFEAKSFAANFSWMYFIYRPLRILGRRLQSRLTRVPATTPSGGAPVK